MVESFYAHASEPFKGKLREPRSFRDSNLEYELPEFLDNFAPESKIVISSNFGSLHLVAPRVRLVGVANASK